jgi:hypothetical protein
MDFLMEQAERLGPAFRAEALVSVARVNPAEALSWYFARSPVNILFPPDAGRFIRAAHWGQPTLMTATAARALSRKDETLWSAILDELEGPNYLSAALAPIALKASPAIATETAWYLAALIADKREVPAAEILASLDATESEDPTASADLILGRESLARALGRAPRNIDGPLRDFVRDGGADRRDLCSDDAWLDQREKKIACPKERRQRRFASRFPRTSFDITPSPFYLVINLPKGVAAEIIEKTQCRDDWVGNIQATVDRAGRVRSLALGDVYTSAECKRALQHLIPLTIAENISIDSAFSTIGALAVKSRKAPLCVDEEPARRDANFRMQRIGGEVKAPVVTRRVEPAWSAAALQKIVGANANSLVIIDSRISETGCVAPLQVWRGSVEGDLNRSALLALAQWQFKPGTLDGVAVPVIFNLSVNFKRP